MQDWLAGTRLVDVVLAITAAEAVALALLHRVGGRGFAPADWVFSLLAGLFLMLALRAAIVGAEGTSLAGWLAAAGVAHGLDMARRWRARAVRPS